MVHIFWSWVQTPPWDIGWKFFQPIHIITKCSIGSKPPHNRKKHNLTSWKHGGHGYLPQRCGVSVRVYIQQRDCVEMFCASVDGVGGSVKGALRLWWNCVGSSHTARLAGGNSPECKRSMRGAPRVERNRKGSHQSAYVLWIATEMWGRSPECKGIAIKHGSYKFFIRQQGRSPEYGGSLR